MTLWWGGGGTHHERWKRLPFLENPWWVFWLNDSEETNHLVFCGKPLEPFGLKAANNKQTTTTTTTQACFHTEIPQPANKVQLCDGECGQSWRDELCGPIASHFLFLLITDCDDTRGRRGLVLVGFIRGVLRSLTAMQVLLSALYNNAIICFAAQVRFPNRLSYVTLLSVGH